MSLCTSLGFCVIQCLFSLKVYTVSKEQLQQHIPKDSLPQRFGGHLVVNHERWLQVCAAAYQSSVVDVDTFFISRKNKQLSMSRSSSDNSDFLLLNGIESEDSKETIAEKQSNEEGEKDEIIDTNGVEKEVNVEKEDVRNMAKRRRESDPSNSSTSHRGSKDFSTPDAMNSNDVEMPPPNPCKKRPGSTGTSNILEDSIHMAEEGGMTIQNLVNHVKSLGKRGLYEEYAAIRKEQPAGTFSVSKYVSAN